ncbi:unnamed protein product [Durusdinium trenchii]|uniref:Uncharacterized protein n=1 Tax=Durusdinium trenchii TaxID=1381693 RepID=A0ABP0SFU5_9DINO
MFWDLNVAWDAKRAGAFADLALRFGFAGIAYNVTVSGQQVHQLPEHHPAMAEPREAVGEAALKLLKEPQVKVLSQLQVLKIFNAGLNQLPETLWNCKELRQLDIGANPLAGALPAAGLAAHLTSLEILFAAKIGLKELPNLADCPKLRMLGVKDNQLSSLDGSLLPDTLEWLIAASNQIRAI